MAGDPFVFADRDGTLIEDRGYTWRIEDYAPLPGAVEGLQLLREAGFRIAVVTNQSGIGRGLFTRAAYDAFESHLHRDFAARGAPLEATYVCPHAPDAGCACRKPAPALLERATRELGADLGASWVIGDKPIDMELAARGGCRRVYVLTGQGAALRADLSPDVAVAPDLLRAARAILAS